MSSDEEYGSREASTPIESGSETVVGSSVQKIAVKIVRTALALNSAKIPLSKTNLQKNAWEDVPFSKVNFFEALDQADKILMDTFGLTIKPLPAKQIMSQGKKKESKTQQYVLVNNIKEPYLKFQLESQWLSKANAQFQSELMETRHDYRNNKQLYPSLSTDQELVFSGLALATVSIIIVSSNHINEVELTDILGKSFGVDPNQNLDVLNISIWEFFKILDKADYVNRSVIKADNEEIVEYSVGRRAKAEFPRESFIEFAKILYDEPDDRPDFINMVNATIDTTFGPKQD